MDYKREHQWNAKWKVQEMSDRDDTCFWLGRPINAMTHEQLQDALIECKLALLLKQNEVIKLRHLLEVSHLEIKNAISSIRNDAVDLRSIC